MAAKITREFRSARKFVEMISPLDFRVGSFAAYLIGESLPVKERIIDLFSTFIFAESAAYNEGRSDPNQINYYIQVERMRDALEVYRR